MPAPPTPAHRRNSAMPFLLQNAQLSTRLVYG